MEANGETSNATETNVSNTPAQPIQTQGPSDRDPSESEAVTPNAAAGVAVDQPLSTALTPIFSSGEQMHDSTPLAIVQIPLEQPGGDLPNSSPADTIPLAQTEQFTSPISTSNDPPPPAYEPSPQQPPEHVESADSPPAPEQQSSDNPDPSEHSLRLRIEAAERKFREATEKLRETVAKNKPKLSSAASDPANFQNTDTTEDGDVWEAAKNIKAQLEIFISQRVPEESRGKSSQLIDRWFQAIQVTFKVVRTTLQFVQVRLFTFIVLSTYRLFQRRIH